VLSLDKQNRYRERYRAMRPGWRTSGEVYESFVRRYVGENSIVLDLGCGAGGVMELFSRNVGLSVGIDPHLPSLIYSRDPFICRSQGRADRLPFASQSFDLVVCSWVLEHVIAPEHVFVEISRVLKFGGRFIFLTPNADNFVTKMNRLAPRLAQARLVRALYGREKDDTFPVVYWANTPRALRRLAQDAGFNVASLELIHDPTYFAFNEIAFRLSVWIERSIADARAVHIVGDMVKNKTAA
jgi:SAM-dependent methyltransferase